MKNFIQKLFFLVVCNFIANITSAQESPALHIELDNLNFIQWDQETNLIETYPNFTIEMWVKGTESAYGGMIYCEGKSNSNSNMFRLWVSGGKVYIRPHGNSTDQIASTGNNIFSDTRGWVHLAVVGTTPGGAGTETTLELFVDGVSNASGTYTRVANNHNRSIIGNLSSTSSQVANYQFDGEVDEFRAWSRALDVSEIANNMCNPASNTGLFRHVRFNESSGSTVYDEIAASSVAIQGTSPTWTTNSECAAGDLVAYYPFNGNADDESSNSNNGTIVGATLTTNRFGEPNSAYEFDGANDYIQIPDADVFSISTTSQLSVSVWMRVDALDFAIYEGTGDYVHWMGKGSNGQKEWLFRMYNKSSPIRPNRTSCYAFNLAGGLGAGSYVEETVSVGEWIHYVMIYDYPTNTIQLYKNGVLKDTDMFSDYSIVPVNGTTPVRIGTSDFNSYFKGAIDDIRIYDGILSSQEISNLYNENSSLSINTLHSKSILDLKLYPNPTSDNLKIYNPKNLDYTFSVIDTYGRIVKKGKLKNQIDLKGLPEGLYIVSVKDKGQGNALLHKKIIKL